MTLLKVLNYKEEMLESSFKSLILLGSVLLLFCRCNNGGYNDYELMFYDGHYIGFIDTVSQYSQIDLFIKNNKSWLDEIDVVKVSSTSENRIINDTLYHLATTGSTRYLSGNLNQFEKEKAGERIFFLNCVSCHKPLELQELAWKENHRFDIILESSKSNHVHFELTKFDVKCIIDYVKKG